MNGAVERLCRGESLEFDRARGIFERIVLGELGDVEISALVTALKAKGESPREIAGAAAALREAAEPFPDVNRPVADTCGTGGDGSGTVNISTAVAFVAAELGVAVVKHGNRSVSSRCGSADVLEEVGVEIEAPTETARACLEEAGVCFLFAPDYHPGIRHAMGVRRALETRTVFNLLGPLLNPARPRYQLLGVYDPELCRPMAKTLDLLGCERAMVVHGAGLDELALHAPSRVALLDEGTVEEFEVVPESLGLRRASVDAIAGGGPHENARWLRGLLSGQGSRAHKHAVALNAGAVAHVAGRAESLQEGVDRARAALQKGECIDRLDRLVEVSRGT